MTTLEKLQLRIEAAQAAGDEGETRRLFKLIWAIARAGAGA